MNIRGIAAVVLVLASGVIANPQTYDYAPTYLALYPNGSGKFIPASMAYVSGLQTYDNGPAIIPLCQITSGQNIGKYQPCPAPTAGGSGTVNAGTQYAIPEYSTAGTAVSPSNVKTDSTGNVLVLPDPSANANPITISVGLQQSGVTNTLFTGNNNNQHHLLVIGPAYNAVLAGTSTSDFGGFVYNGGTVSTEVTNTTIMGFAIGSITANYPVAAPSVTTTAINSQSIGTIASASTIAPTTELVTISGTTAIATITPPTNFSATVGGCIDILATGAWTTTTAGNIYAAMTAVSGTTYRACWMSDQKFHIK